jgi:hypothetical protein
VSRVTREIKLQINEAGKFSAPHDMSVYKPKVKTTEIFARFGSLYHSVVVIFSLENPFLRTLSHPLLSHSLANILKVDVSSTLIKLVGITAARTVKPCQADQSGNYVLLELSFSRSCSGVNTGMQIVATSSVDKYGPTVRNIALILSNPNNLIYSMLRIYHYYYCDFIKTRFSQT